MVLGQVPEDNEPYHHLIMPLMIVVFVLPIIGFVLGAVALATEKQSRWPAGVPVNVAQELEEKKFGIHAQRVKFVSLSDTVADLQRERDMARARVTALEEESALQRKAMAQSELERDWARGNLTLLEQKRDTAPSSKLHLLLQQLGRLVDEFFLFIQLWLATTLEFMQCILSAGVVCRV